MKIDEYIKVNQPVLNQILLNTSKNDNYAHAYLLSGTFGIPVLDIAKFFAKTIFCKNKSPLACDSCENCEKINHDTFLPLKIVDGSSGTISKDQIKEIEEIFSNTSQEKSNKQVYIINFVEYMRVDAVNALLKFLEEPNDNVYAILTTHNILKTIPTIVSRCQVIRLNPSNKDLLIKESIDLGIAKDDAELLSFIYSTVEDVTQYSKDENYLTIKTFLLEYLKKLVDDSHGALFLLEQNITSITKSKELQRYFIDLLLEFLTDALKKHVGNSYTLKSYDKLLDALYNKVSNIEEVIFLIYKKRSEIELNINANLLFIEINKILLEGK